MLPAMDVAVTIEGFKSGALSADAFRRFIVSANSWAVAKQGDMLALRSDSELGKSGVDIFRAIDGATRAVKINAGTAHEIEIAPEDFAAFRAIAAAVGIERAWERIAAGTEKPEDLSDVVRFPAYQIAAVKAPEGYLLIHASHDDGGVFVPLFTHRDALLLALEEFRRNFPPDIIACTETPGIRLFPPLANEKADGIVINYLGPTKPVAFRMDVLPLILDALEKPK